jgi:hypothetical protein
VEGIQECEAGRWMGYRSVRQEGGGVQECEAGRWRGTGV